MSVEGIFAVANSALTAQSQRMTLIAQNLANVDSVNSPEGGPYQRQIAVFEAQQLGAGAGAAVGVKVAQVVKDNAPGAEIFDPSNPFADEPEELGEGAGAGTGVRLAQVLKDSAPPHEVFDPSNPYADQNGVVKEPNVNPVFEMVDLMQASRSYQANLSVIQSANTSAMKTLDLLK